MLIGQSRSYITIIPSISNNTIFPYHGYNGSDDYDGFDRYDKDVYGNDSIDLVFSTFSSTTFEYPVVSYDNIRDGFIEWIRGRVSEEVARDYISSLDRHVSGKLIKKPSDITKILNGVERGKDKLIKAIRNLINYCVEKEMISEEFANKLRRVAKTQCSGVDLYVPSDDEVREWIKKVEREDVRLAVLIIVFGGLRIKEAVRILEKFDKGRLNLEKINGTNIAYYRLNWRRRTKQISYAFMPAWLGKELRKFNTNYYKVQSYAVRRGIKMKYLRKWFINKMIEFEVPESVVRFIIGHSQRQNVMGLHYLDLLRQAKMYYAKVVHNIEKSVLGEGMV